MKSLQYTKIAIRLLFTLESVQHKVVKNTANLTRSVMHGLTSRKRRIAVYKTSLVIEYIIKKGMSLGQRPAKVFYIRFEEEPTLIQLRKYLILLSNLDLNFDWLDITFRTDLRQLHTAMRRCLFVSSLY